MAKTNPVAAVTGNTEFGPEVTLRELRELIPSLYRLGKPAFLWGSPGIGKSDTLRDISKKLGLKYHLVQLQLMDTPDLQGLPFVVDGKTRWCPPDFIPRDPCLIVLDEMNAAPSAVQVAANLLLLEKQWGNVHLHPECYVMGAGNCAAHRAVVNPMPTSTRNRVAHFNIKVDAESWIGDYGMEKGFDSTDLAFIAAYPDWLSKFDTQQHAFPSPRSWSSIFSMEESERQNHKLVSSIVGEGAALQYSAWHSLLSKLPRIKEIISSPDTCRIPEDTPSRWALVGILTTHCLDEKKVPLTDIQKTIAYMKRFNQQELLVFFCAGLCLKRATAFSLPEMRSIAELIQKYTARQK